MTQTGRVRWVCAGRRGADLVEHAPHEAQLSPPNAAGVAMGHLHYHVRDVDANKRFWMALGGVPATIGTTDVDPVSRRVRRADKGRVVWRHGGFRRQPRGVPRPVAGEGSGRRVEGPAPGAVSGRGLGDEPRRRADRAVRRDRDEYDVHARRRPDGSGADRHNHPITAPDHRLPHSSVSSGRHGGEGEGVVREDVRRRPRDAVALSRGRSARHQHELLGSAAAGRRRRAAGCSITSASR